MNIYVLCYFVISSFLLDRRLNKKILGLSYIGALLIFLFMALRYGYGNDYFNYAALHASYHDYGVGKFSFESFYKEINLLSPNFQFVVLTQSLFFMSAFLVLGKALRRLECNLSLVALLVFLNPYLYLIHLTAIRQSMAICIFVLFVSLFLMYRRYLFIVLAITLPMLFHKAALVYLVSIPLLIFIERIYAARWHHKILYSAVTIYLIYLILEVGMSGILGKYNVYIERSLGGPISITTLLYVVWLSFLFLTSKPRKALDGESERIYTTLHALVFLSLILSTFSIFFPHFSRITLFFDFFIPFYFACSRFVIPRYFAYISLVSIYLIRNYTFLSTEIYGVGFGTYRIFLFP